MDRSQSVAERVVESVAKATETDVVELPTLYGAIEPDALDAVVHAMTDGEIQFEYADHAVTVQSDGAVTVTRQSERPTSAADD